MSNSDDKTHWQVSLEFKRLQTYLFAVPNLKTMIGANAILGETIRGVWQSKKRRFAPDPDPTKISSLPALAVWWGSGGFEDMLTKYKGSTPLASQEDPLEGEDDPTAVATTTGVLSRDGGHFEVLFQCPEKAKAFIMAAQALIAKTLPGVILDVTLNRIERQDDVYYQARDAEKLEQDENRADLFDLPQAMVCEISGMEPAAHRSNLFENKPVAASVDAKQEKASAFDQGNTHDVLGLLREPLLDRCGNRKLAVPNEFRQLSTQGYIAVIHIDGNSVGKKTRKFVKPEDDFVKAWCERETFFHQMRSTMRIALLAAIENTFNANGVTLQGHPPFRLLMLGGDDLLLVCGATYALRFVIELAEQAVTHHFPVSLGAGVTIVKHGFPFHRAHALAEQLASSAKHLKAVMPDTDTRSGFVVDWMVCSEAWSEDIRHIRQKQYLQDHCILSAKPYRILRHGAEVAPDGKKSLQEMLADVEKLTMGITSTTGSRRPLARGQLHVLREALRRGRRLGEFAVAALPESIRCSLGNAGFLNKEGDLSPWWNRDLGGNVYHLTFLLDLLELYELEVMREQEFIEAGKDQVDAAKMEVPHAG